MIFGKRPPHAVRRHVDAADSAETAIADDGAPDSQVIRTPRLKPFARSATPAPPSSIIPVPKAAASSKPAPKPAPRPAKAVAQPNPRGGAADARQIPGHTLVVGRDIRLTGEISACHRLIVEGSVEADLTDTHTLEIAGTGHFRGSACVGNCVIGGSFEGDLTVNGLLAVRAGGRVGGAIRYAEIEVERGGRITGSTHLQDPQERAATPASAEALGPNGGIGPRPA